MAPKDLEILRLALDAPIVPVSRAAIQPSSDSLAAISQLLPSGPSESPARSRFARASSLSNLYSDIALLSNVDSASYFLSDFAQQHAISPLVERRSRGRLTVSEREKFANAPANTRDERVVAILGNFIEAYGRGELVRFEDAAADLGMLEALEDMLALREEARAIRAERLGRTLEEDAALDTTPVATPGIATSAGAPSSNPSFGIRPTSSGPTLASYLPPSHRLLSTNTLMVLESLHRSLSLYLWLSFRFSLAFCHRQDVERMKVQAEKAIEFCLEGIRFGRATRMSAAERKAERKESEDGPAEPRFGQAQAQAQASQGPVASGAEVSV